MDWQDCGDEGFMIENEGRVSMIVLSAQDMVDIAMACLEGDFELYDPDSGNTFLDSDDDFDNLRLARDLLTAALERQGGAQPAVLH